MTENTVKKKILLVDDHDFSLDFALTILEEKYEVSTATSGQDALYLLLHEGKPDLILLDIIMPEMDGWETFHKIKGISLLTSIPIAFLTSSNDTETINRSQKIGAIDFIAKPYNREELLSRVENILAR